MKSKKNVLMKRMLSLLVSLALSGSSMAFAQNVQLDLTPEHFAALNGKSSGGVSKEEYEKFIREAFQKLDTDRSNTLSRAETAKVLTSEQFAAIDEDKNAELTLDELIKQITRDFDRYDSKQNSRPKP